MKLKKFGGTEQRIYDLIAPLVTELGYLVWDVRFEKEGANRYLRIFIDSETDTISINITRSKLLICFFNSFTLSSLNFYLSASHSASLKPTRTLPSATAIGLFTRSPSLARSLNISSSLIEGSLSFSCMSL